MNNSWTMFEHFLRTGMYGSRSEIGGPRGSRPPGSRPQDSRPPRWRQVGPRWGLCWAKTGAKLGLCWAKMGPSWRQVGPMLEPPGTILGPLEVYEWRSMMRHVGASWTMCWTNSWKNDEVHFISQNTSLLKKNTIASIVFFFKSDVFCDMKWTSTFFQEIVQHLLQDASS